MLIPSKPLIPFYRDWTLKRAGLYTMEVSSGLREGMMLLVQVRRSWKKLESAGGEGFMGIQQGCPYLWD